MDLPTAASQRTALMGRLIAFIEWSATPGVQDLDFYQIKSRIDRYEVIFNAFESANAIVAGGTGGEVARSELWKEFNDLDDRYVAARAELNRRFVELTPAVTVIPTAAAANATTSDAANQDAQPHYVLQMPFQAHSVVPTWGKFNGDLLKWSDFKERFMLGVHNVDAMPEAYKISHLRNALTGEAAQAMSGFALLEGNYEQLWNALIKEYECKFPTACAYLSKFFALPQMKTITLKAELKRMVNDTNEMLRQLRAMKYPVDGYDLILVHALQQRLNKDCRKKWSEITKGNDNPTIARMLEFLNDQATTQANQEVTYQNQGQAERTQGANRTPHFRASSADETTKYPCPVCKSSQHKVFVCPDFNPLTVADRRKVATMSKLCYNCLKGGHYTNECYDLHRCREDRCVRRNDTMHNSMLCPSLEYRTESVTTVRHDRSTSPTPYRSMRGRGRENQQGGSGRS